MKSQDILLLLKLASLTHPAREAVRLRTEGWEDWSRRYDPSNLDPLQKPIVNHGGSAAPAAPSDFSVRGLAEATGISKSQVSLSMRHCDEIGLLTLEGARPPLVNRRGLFEFLVYGARFVFPVRPGAATQGIATGVAAPVFEGKLFSAAQSAQVWPDVHGNTFGQAIAPLSPSVPHAVRRDPVLYGMLALLDSFRVGGARERGIAEVEFGRLLGIRK